MRKLDDRARVHGSLKPELWPVFLLLALGLAVGFLIATDYGVSTDEPRNAEVGASALKAYAGSTDYFLRDALVEHGPVYFMFFSATSNALVRVFHGWQLPDGRHFTNFVTFLAGLFFFYLICLRLVRRLPALVATALFGTQPLLFGSAFINQKDIPFMVAFLAVIALGLKAGERGQVPKSQDSAPDLTELLRAVRDFVERIRLEWQRITKWRRRALVGGPILLVAFILDVLVLGVLRRFGESIVVAAFNGRAIWPIQSLFTLIATDAYKTPLELYLGRYEVVFGVLAAATAILAVGVIVIAYTRALPSLAEVLNGTWSIDRYPPLLAGAVFLGCAMSIRQIGLFAGGLVSLYVLYRGRLRAIFPLCVYWAVAALVAYATWPYLWPDPIRNALSSFTVIQEFDTSGVFFQGQVYQANALPWNYFPTLVGVQLTEPALLLIALGAVMLAWRTWKRSTKLVLVGLLGVWFVAPVFWLILRSIPIYNSIRHFFFVLPPLFVLAAVGLEAIFSLSRRVWIRGVMIVLALAPGIWGIALLHPYEYIYFNSIAGGVSGAYDRFEQDYWCISLKEAMDFVNLTAPPGSILRILGPVQSAAPYVREDLRRHSLRTPISKADIVAVCPLEPRRQWDSSAFKIVYEVTRGRAVLTEVWQRQRPPEPAVSPP